MQNDKRVQEGELPALEPHVHCSADVTEDVLNLEPGSEPSSLQTTPWMFQPFHSPCWQSARAKLSIYLVFFRRYLWRSAVEINTPND